MSLEESLNEKIRFPADLWMDWKSIDLKQKIKTEE